jgi:hypothetical protein
VTSLPAATVVGSDFSFQFRLRFFGHSLIEGFYMPVFKIQKYEPKPQVKDQPDEKIQEQDKTTDDKKEQSTEITIRADKTISEIIASALNAALADKAKIENIDESKVTNIDIDIVSTETIDKDPLNTLRATSKSGSIYYYSQESKIPPTVSWFIMNARNNGKNFIYSTEGLCRYVIQKLEV